MRGQQLVFCQCHSSRTSYHARTDLWHYRINLFTRAPVYFQQKTNLALNYQIDPQIVLRFSAHTRYSKWCLFCVVYYFCAGNRFENGNPRVSNKYKNGEINKNNNSNHCNINHLHFEMVYHYSKWSPCTVLNHVLMRNK